jgi:hypothetical protein
MILLVSTTLSIFKPWGKTPSGRRKPPETLFIPLGAVAAVSIGVATENSSNVAPVRGCMRTGLGSDR